MTRLFSILIAMLAAVTAAAGVRLPSGAEQFGSLVNVVGYFQQVSSAAGTGTSTHLQRTAVRRYTGAGHIIDNDSVKMTRFPGGYLSRGGAAFYYLTDYQGNNIAVVDAAGAITQRTYYYPYGEPWRYPTGQQYLFSDKELTRADGRHAYTFPARTLLPNLPRWSTPDPLAEQTPWDSPYAYCAANPIANIDPTGLNPIYGTDGNLLGVTDSGLQGSPIFMNKDDFKFNMSYEEATALDLKRESLEDENAVRRFENSYINLCNRPDWDGYLTLDEANDWYHNGNGQPLYTDLKKIDLSFIFSLGDQYVDQEKTFNLLFDSASLNDGLVYGNITLKRYPNDCVRAFHDKYDFDIKPWRLSTFVRNIQTMIGRIVAGNGIPYEIRIYGTAKLKRKNF